jgi:uncharacterized protein (TIGR02147 family)
VDVFKYLNYKDYLKALIDARPRGERSRVAEVLRCHLAYISQVLNGGADFSLEQAESLNGYLGHSPEESDFFILLVSLGRAGTAALRSFYQRKITAALEERAKNRLPVKEARVLEIEKQATYYSAWYYAAIHMLLSIPEFKDENRLARHLGLSVSVVRRVMQFLESAEILSGAARIHVTGESPLNTKHHMNWRLQALQSLEREIKDDFHYSSVISIAEKDRPKIEKILAAAIQEIRSVVKESGPEDSAFCYTADIFRI